MSESPPVRPPELAPKAKLPHAEGRWQVIPGRLSVAWRKRARVENGVARTTPGVAPDPAFPEGVDIDLSEGHPRTCAARLPHYAGLLGMYEVRCMVCDLSVAITSAGRADDPRLIRVPCWWGRAPS